MPLSGSRRGRRRTSTGSSRARCPCAARSIESRNVPTIRARHGARRAERDRRGAQVRAHDADPRVSVDLHRRGGRLSDRDGRRLLGVRHARHARRSRSAIVRVEDQKGNVLWEPEPTTVSVHVARRGVAHGEHDEGRRAARDRGAEAWARSSTIPPAERPAPRTTAPTSGSSATRRTSSPASGWASTSRRRSRRTRRAAMLAAPAWTAFMNGGLSRKRPAPRDWPMPADIVTRQIDVSTNMLATPYCPRDVGDERILHPGHRSDAVRATSTSRRCCIRTRSGVTGSYPDRHP